MNNLKEAPPLPSNPEEWVRKVKLHKTINDQVEEVHHSLLSSVQSGEYLRLLQAVYDEQAVEGSLAADNYSAAARIRLHAADIGVRELKGEKLATISKALGVVLHRYGVSRRERRQMIDGKVVANGD